MKKLKKSLSVLLTLVMLFTTLCFFPLDLGKVEADAAIAGIKIVVPETLYLTPSTGATQTIQYYINNNADGSVKATQDTTAQVHITYPGAKLTSISASASTDTSAVVTLPTSITGLAGTTFGSTATTATGTFSLPLALNVGGTALVEWTFVFDVNGKTQTHYAYSIAYAPWYQPVGAATRAVGAHHNVFSSSFLWVSGAHGYENGDSGNRHYPKTDTFLPMLGVIQAPSNTGPDTYIQSDATGLGDTISYYNIGNSGTNYHARANSISPTAKLTVDTSRYNNLNQIPNLTFGFMVTDRENANEGTWYLSDYGITSGTSYYNGTDRGSSRYDSDYNDTGTKLLEGSDTTTSVKYNGTWDKAVTGTTDYRLKSAVYGYHGGVIKSTSWDNNFVNLSVTGADKGTLRSYVLGGTSYAKENYTADTWNTYYNALRSAAVNLCNPTSATTDTANLSTAEAGLHTTLYLNANGGTLGSSTPESVAMQVGGNPSTSFNNADVVGAFNATRTGYTFLGWSTDMNATTAPTTVTVGLNDTVYAVWKANTYNVVFDNLFDFSAFNISTGKLEINERTETGFTVTSTDTDGADANTGFSAPISVEPGKTYIISADVAIERVAADIKGYDIYVNTLNASKTGDSTSVPDTTNGAHTEGGVYISLTGQKTETKPYIRFTAGSTTAYITIRFDANTEGNKLTVNNIRVYEEGTIADGVSYEAPYTATYDKKYALPTPTRENYAFAGWYTTPSGDGTRYSTGDAVKITDTLHLYSRWTDANYYIEFDANTGNGTMEKVKANIGENYTLPANTFTKTGYHFVGWSTDKSATAATYGDKAGVQLANTVSTVTLYAVWTKNDYTIKYAGGDGATGNTEPQAVKYDETATIRANGFSKPGYIFKGWTDGTTTYAAGQDVKNLTTVNGATITLTAIWEPITFTVDFVIADVVVDTLTVTYDNGDAAAFNAVKDKFNVTGYTFGGWETDAGAAVTSDNFDNLVTVNGGEITIYAIENVNSYTVQYNGNTATSGDTAQQTFKYTDIVTISSNGFTKTGYTFKGWAESADGPVKYQAGQTGLSALTAEPDGIVTLYAVWEANTYTVKFDNNDAAATGSTADVTLTYDAQGFLTANGFSKTGYTFVGWAETADGEAVYEDGAEVINLTSEKNGVVTLYAVWEINTFAVKFVYKTVDGTDTSTDFAAIEYGTAFNTIVPAYSDVYYLSTDGENHYNFTGWENKVDTITEAVVFTAQYEAEAHELYEDLENTVAPDCENDGVKAVFCDCGYKHQEVDPSKGHDYQEVAGTNTATCTEGGFVTQKCSKCNETISVPSSALGHIEKEAAKENNVDATCTADGSYDMVVRCDRCNAAISTEHFTVDATGHNFGEVTEAVAPGCTSTGNEAYKSCTVCNKFFAENAGEFSEDAKDSAADFTLEAAGHKTTLVPAVAPECEKDGNIAYYTCENCDLLFSDEAGENVITIEDTVDPMTGHSYTSVVTAPTCTEAGFTTHTCSKCNDKYTDSEVPKLGHTEGEAVEENRTESTCTVKGSYESVVKCTVCGEELSRETVELEHAQHKYEAVVTPPTCVDNGYTTHTCSECGDNYTDTPVTKLGHTKGAEVVENEVDATCTTDGSYDTVTYCTVCGAETSRVTTVVGKLGHSEGAAVEENRTESTCTKNGSYDSVVYCITCGEKLSSTKVDLPLAEHKYESVVTKPTCTTEGYTTHTCSACNATYTDSEVPELGHTAGETKIENNDEPDCTTGGSYDEAVYCTVCGEELSRNKVTVDALGHKYDAVVTSPNCTDGGFTTYTCSVCGDTYIADKTDALGHKAGEAVVENEIKASCLVDGSYQEVIYCSVCGEELSRTDKVHVAPGHTEAVRQENISNATCTVAGSYDNVTYCTVCNEVFKRETVTGVTLPHAYEEMVIDADHLKTEATCVDYAVYYYDCKDCTANAKAVDGATFEYVDGGYDADNHTTTDTTLKDVVTATCYSDGHEGNLYHNCCNIVAVYGNVISKDTVAHTAGTVVVENNILPTCYSEGSYDNVTYCSVCEAAGQGKVQTSRETVTVDKVAHTAGEVVVENNILPTCYSEGSYDNVTYCSVCKAAGQGNVQTSRETVTVAKVAHTAGEVVVENNVLPTCYATGSYDNVTYCSVCAAAGKEPVETSRKTVIVAKTAHTPAAAVEEDVVPATCYSEGSYNAVVYCSVAECGHKISSTPKTIEKTAHTPAEAVEEDVVPATCYAEGSYNAVVYCSVAECGHKISSTPKTIEKIAHTAGEEVIENEIEATCYSTGSYDKVTYCSVCKAAGQGNVQTSRETVTVVMKAHTPAEAVTENVVAPKCEEDGHHDVVIYCSVCAAAGKKFEISRETVVDAMTGHTEGEAKVENNIPATCTVNGSYDLVVRCTVCNEIISSEAKVNVAPGHTPAEKVIENNIPATCTVDGSYDEVVYCSVCGFEISRTGKTHTAPGHKAGEPVNENIVKATCTEDGSYEVATYCTVCGEEITREYKTTDALGHTPEEAVIENEVKVTCTTDGSYDTVVYCGICGVEISRETTVEGAPGHKAGEVVYENVIPATETENGKRDEVTYCTVCGTELSRETVILKPVRIITFIMHDETIEIEAHTGDTLTPPTVKSYESADGFIHQFKSWDKEIAVVTGNATYTATYTEPCDYTEIDRLEETLNDILSGGLIDDATLNEYKDQIDDIKAKLEVINANRNTLDKDNQSDIDVVVGDLEELVDYIYPDVGSTLEIVGASTFYTGSILDLKAVKMPANAVISEVQWTSSDDNIVFCSNGKLFAIGIGTVTITAKRGILTATKTINVVEGGDVRAINFISMDKAHIIVEDYFTVFNAAGLYWSDANEIRFRVHVYQNFPYETYIVYINGVEAEADADGYYTVPANAGNVRVSIAGAVYKDDADGTGSSGKWSFWEWLLMIFRKIAALFGITL